MTSDSFLCLSSIAKAVIIYLLLFPFPLIGHVGESGPKQPPPPLSLSQVGPPLPTIT